MQKYRLRLSLLTQEKAQIEDPPGPAPIKNDVGHRSSAFERRKKE